MCVITFCDSKLFSKQGLARPPPSCVYNICPSTTLSNHLTQPSLYSRKTHWLPDYVDPKSSYSCLHAEKIHGSHDQKRQRTNVWHQLTAPGNEQR